MAQNQVIQILLIVLILCTVGIALIFVWYVRNRSKTRIHGRIQRFVDEGLDSSTNGTVKTTSEASGTNIVRIREFLNRRLSALSSEKLQLKISSAYWPMTDTEYIILQSVLTVFGFVFGWLIPGNIFGGLFLGILLFLVPKFMLDRAIIKRQQKFQSQLLDVLIMIKGAVQAGYSLSQALDMTISELIPPSSEEFSRVLRETRFGFPLDKALLNLSERMESDDLKIVITAIIINAQVGGSLATVLESTIETIRDRMQLFSEVRSLSSYARYVGQFLTLLPFLTGFIIFLVTPDYFSTVLVSRVTQIILIFALIGILIGNFWIRNIVRIRV